MNRLSMEVLGVGLLTGTVLTGCAGNGGEMPPPAAESPVLTTTTTEAGVSVDELEDALTNLTPEREEILSCMFFEAFGSLSPEGIARGVGYPIALGVKLYVYQQDEAGVWGTSVITNPLVNDCELESGSVIKTLTAGEVLGEGDSGAMALTGTGAFIFFEDGSVGSLTPSDQIILQVEPQSVDDVWGPNGQMRAEYFGETTQLAILPGGTSDSTGLTTRGLTTLEGTPVMTTEFFPGQTPSELTQDPLTT